MSKFLVELDLSIAHVIGTVAALIFYGRFYLQWYISERQRRSVIPIGFWYMSVVGSLLLFGYGVYTQSPVGTLSHCFNIVIYVRNLIHIWRVQGTLSRRRTWLVHGAALLTVAIAAALLALTWFNVLEETQAEPAGKAQRTWLWIAVGVAGQALFACRFLLQWFTTERKKESVVPVAFWHFSIAASLLMFASFVQLKDWVFALGIATTLPVYTRNLWLIHRRKQEFSEAA